MKKCYVLVHTASYRYVKHIADYIYLQVKTNAPVQTELVICNQIEALQFEKDSLAFVIGEPFNFVERIRNCKIVFLNFSVVAILGSMLECSVYAYLMIRRKRRMLERKIPFIDYLLDFWPSQTSALDGKISIPVRSFKVGLLPTRLSSGTKNSDKLYDVCIVGSTSKRRGRIIEELRGLGLQLSPTNGVVLEDVAAISKIVLNVHTYRSNHLEYPRMLGAFATGAVLVTERSYDIEKYFPERIYVGVEYDQIAPSIRDLLSRPSDLLRISDDAYEWFIDRHLVACESEWKQLFQIVCTDLNIL